MTLPKYTPDPHTCVNCGANTSKHMHLICLPAIFDKPKEFLWRCSNCDTIQPPEKPRLKLIDGFGKVWQVVSGPNVIAAYMTQAEARNNLNKILEEQ